MPIPQLVWAIGLLLASFAIQLALRPKTEKPKPSALEDFNFPQVKEGTPQSVVFGDVWISDWHVLWYGNLRSSPVKADASKK